MSCSLVTNSPGNGFPVREIPWGDPERDPRGDGAADGLPVRGRLSEAGIRLEDGHRGTSWRRGS